MTDKQLEKTITEFVSGLLKKADCTHAGNCLVVSQILEPYLLLFGINTILMRADVKQGVHKINHFFLFRKSDGKIIDPTSSQFKFPNGNKMPKTYIGALPYFYTLK